MSAFIVDREDIDVIVTALNAAGIVDGGLGADSAGRMLWAENLRSLMYRYPNDGDGERPGPIDFRDSDVDTYTWTPRADGLDPKRLAEVIGCYRYQSCEHPEWESSQAYAITARFENAWGEF